jgi:glycosyltransferase involved in cell wall biosynthesis
MVGHVADFAALARPAAVAVDRRDPAALADAIVDLVADRARRDTIADAARHWATRHDALFTAETFEQLYRRLIGVR